MRFYFICLSVLVASILAGCGSNPKPKTAANNPVQAQETDEIVKLNETLQKKIGSWAKEGKECYGLVLLTGKSNKAVEYGKSVKTVIVRLTNDSIKVKVLENITLAKTKNCDKMGLNVGYNWWEKEGDLFLTREEADKYLKDKGWDFKDKTKGKFRIGD